MSISSAASSSSPTSSAFGTKIPRVGGVRCYWALLTPHYTPLPPNPDGTPSAGSKLELRFAHPDPMLSLHLSKQKLSMMGRSVIEFIHPAEREQARRDLTSAISADDLQGSVTRVRFARLSRIRTILGCPPEENDFPADADKFAEDDEYLILDLVLNWVADGFLLAFFHAIKDKDPIGNNDPRLSHEEWSNWCGTRVMPEDQIEALHRNISDRISSTPSSSYPPSRVFQLHYSAPSPDPSISLSAPPRLIFSWPPPRPVGVKITADGKYNAAEYCELMKGVDMDPSQLNAGPGELRTNCTTRYGAQHSITTEGVYRHVTSVFIPYGNLIFACFQTTSMYELPAARNGHTPSSSSSSYEPSLGNDWNTNLSSIPPVTSGSTGLPVQPLPPSDPQPQPHPYTTQPSIQTTSTWAHSDPYALPRQDGGEWESGPSTGYQIHPGGRDMGYLTPSPSANHYPPPQQHYPHDHLPHGGIPLSASMSSGHLSSGPSPPHMANGHHGHSMSNGGSNGSASSRPLVRPPGNVDCCVMCGIRESPEWRRNESGIKDLCNACGLRLARQVAKREGRQKPRKKKDSTGVGGNGMRGESATKDHYGI
ncbi:hypothetical protein I302_107543 [Kwoniella bestiolae CBS 10118]|uniref:GATA-type domain-containing protein n=1 Tax=Kwoniella bestiolae CBS 10118 TaxID=1296100 RepID=A0A1B9FY90_9TREE|nr:hypothetical protein I302_06715 [Kwoniella bestiolae CBS 10118]OCF23732.1 hypothetical protein I302_06715 [Kwoniella bestiolae CBS 10118]